VGGCVVEHRETARQDCDESRPKGGQAPNQASSGRQTGAVLTDESLERHAPNAASHLKSHTRHGGHQAGDGPRQTDQRVSQSLDVDDRSDAVVKRQKHRAPELIA
jgi:hypothetical protein